MKTSSNIAAQHPPSRRTPRQAEAPRPRSVVILPPPPAAIAPLGAGSLNLHDSRSRLAHNLASAKQLNGLKNAKELTASSPWDVSDVPNIPTDDFPIERTHAILADVSPSVIANRIAACLRERSIAADYNNENATCLAEMGDSTKFYVRLFKSDSCDGVLVEVQKRCGCCVRFHEAAQAILRAAKGLPPEDTKGRPSLSESFLAKCGDFKCASKLRKHENGDNDEEDINGALEVADCLLHRDRLDANLLGMESLRFLTDPKSSGPETAATAAKAILACSGEGNGLAIKDAIMSLVHFWNLHGDSIELDDDCDVAIRINNIMHNHALAVLANSIPLLANGDQMHASVMPPELCEDKLLSVLAEEMASFETRPNNSYQAARCINGLMHASADFKLRPTGQDVVSLVEGLKNSDACKRHALLENELSQLDKAFKSFTTCI